MDFENVLAWCHTAARYAVPIVKTLLKLSLLASIAAYQYGQLYNGFIKSPTATVPIYLNFPSDSSSAYPSCLTPLLNNTASRGTFLSDQIHISAATVDVDAELLLPETPAFIDGGMQMIFVHILDVHGNVTHASARPISPPPPPPPNLSPIPLICYPLRNKFLSAALHRALQVQRAAQRVDVPILRDVPFASHRFDSCAVKLSSPHLRLYALSLRFAVRYSGLRFFMTNYFLTSAFLAVFVLMVVNFRFYLFVKRRLLDQPLRDDDDVLNLAADAGVEIDYPPPRMPDAVAVGGGDHSPPPPADDLGDDSSEASHFDDASDGEEVDGAAESGGGRGGMLRQRRPPST